jgi:hypothetical protein
MCSRGIFFLNIFDPQLVKSMDVEPTDIYLKYTTYIYIYIYDTYTHIFIHVKRFVRRDWLVRS